MLRGYPLSRGAAGVASISGWSLARVFVPRFESRARLRQFVLQAFVVALVGATIGLERTVVPLLATEEFGISQTAVVMSFVLSFGIVKALVNLGGGILSERVGRKPLLVIGWLFALPVPFLLLFAHSWWLVIAANLFLGVNQGLTWSMTINSKLDLAGAERRGLALGVNEFAGYGGVALSALLTSLLAERFGLRPAPFLFGIGIVAIGFLTSLLVTQETVQYTIPKNTEKAPPAEPFWHVFRWASWGDPRAFAICQAGLAEKFVDTAVWLLFPLYFVAQGLSVGAVGLLVFAYGITWGLGQLLSGPLSDYWGRRWFIVVGMFLCAVAMGIVPLLGVRFALVGAVLAGVGMAGLYPTLPAALADITPRRIQASGHGVYRFWRDLGYAAAALTLGLIADAAGFAAAFYFVAILMAGSTALVIFLLPRRTIVGPLLQR